MSGASALFIQTANAALLEAGWTAAEVDCVVTALTTDIATPALEAQATHGALKAAGLGQGQIAPYVCNPGGAKVIAAIKDALVLGPGRLDAGTTGQMMACAPRPGFTASYSTMHVQAPAA